MAYDEDLAGRIRELLAGTAGVSEMRMFGGLSFLVGGNMAVAASGQGGLLVRLEPEAGDGFVAAGRAEPMVMGGRSMSGWIRLAPEMVRTRRQLGPWVRRGVEFAASLPPKTKARAKAGRSRPAAGA